MGFALQSKPRPGDAVSVASDDGPEIRGLTEVARQVVVTQDDIGHRSMAVRHSDRLDDATVIHDADLDTVGIGQHEQVDGPPRTTRSGTVPVCWHSTWIAMPMGLLIVLFSSRPC